MYVKIAMENPSWNDKAHTIGSAVLSVQKVVVTQGADIPANVPRAIPISLMDYTWFTPGGGGGMSYTTFLPR